MLNKERVCSAHFLVCSRMTRHSYGRRPRYAICRPPVKSRLIGMRRHTSSVPTTANGNSRMTLRRTSINTKSNYDQQHHKTDIPRNTRRYNLARGLFCNTYLSIWLEFYSKPVRFFLVFYPKPRHRIRHSDRFVRLLAKSYSWRRRERQGSGSDRNNINRRNDFLLRPLSGKSGADPRGYRTRRVCRAIPSQVVLVRTAV